MDRATPASPCCRRAIGALAFAGIALGPVVATAQGVTEPPQDDLPTIWAAAKARVPDRIAPAAEDPTQPQPAEPALAKSYVLPAAEIVGFSVLLNAYNRHFSGDSDYDSNISTIRHNLHSSWVTDSDPFRTNQLGHPYLGSMYHGFARSAGLNYWEAFAY